MDLEKVLHELRSSPAMQEIAREMHQIIKDVREGRIKARQGSVEIARCKNLIQQCGMIWHFDGREKNLPKEIKQISHKDKDKTPDRLKIIEERVEKKTRNRECNEEIKRLEDV